MLDERPTCEHAGCAAPGTMGHSVFGQLATVHPVFCDAHSAEHLNDPHLLSAGPWYAGWAPEADDAPPDDIDDLRHPLADTHGDRFRHVSNRFPTMVAVAYEQDMETASRASDEQVAQRVAQFEREQGWDPADWVAIGHQERHDES
jgi:hypothetical protein